MTATDAVSHLVRRPGAGLVVVGASLAGLRTVESARSAGFDGPITLIGDEPDHPYDRPPLSKAFMADPGAGVPSLADADELRALDVVTRFGAAATGLDVDDRAVVVGADRVRFDTLVIATGSAPVRLSGADDIAAVLTLRTAADAALIREHVHRGSGGTRALVVGAGFIGAEIATALHQHGAEVTIVEATDVPLSRAVGDDVAPLLVQLHDDAGIDLRCGVAVESMSETGAAVDVALSDGTALTADVVITGVGARPNTAWLDGSGLTIDDGVVCDETLTAAPGILAAGDVARWHNPLFDRWMRQQSWTSANEHGLAAGRNVADPASAKPVATVPYFWSDWYGRRIQMLGIAGPEVRVLRGDDASWLALYLERDRIVGALALDLPRRIMKFRSLIAGHGSPQEALHLAAGFGLEHDPDAVVRSG